MGGGEGRTENKSQSRETEKYLRPDYETSRQRVRNPFFQVWHNFDAQE